MFRLKGQGIKDQAHGYGKGDQHVMVNIEVPAKLSGKEEGDRKGAPLCMKIIFKNR